MSEEDENEYNLTKDYTYEEIIEYWDQHPELPAQISEKNIPVIDMTYEEFLEKYNLVDMTDFFKSHGLKIEE